MDLPRHVSSWTPAAQFEDVPVPDSDELMQLLRRRKDEKEKELKAEEEEDEDPLAGLLPTTITVTSSFGTVARVVRPGRFRNPPN